MNLNKLKIYNKQLQDLPQDRKRNRTPSLSFIRESTSSFASSSSSKTNSSGVRRPSKVSKVEVSGDKGRGKSEAAGVKAIKLIVL